MRAGRRGLLAALIGVVLTAACAQQGVSLIERADEVLFDAQVAVVRSLRAPHAAMGPHAEVAVVGIDEATLAALEVPMALMHAPLGKALQAISASAPLAIGLDLALPERSFDRLVPGLDRDLMRGLLAARSAAGIVLVLDVDGAGRPRIPPAPLLAAAGGSQAFGLALFPLDCDGVVRRFDPDPVASLARYGAACDAQAKWASPGWRPPWDDASAGQSERAQSGTPAVPTFVGALARRLGRAQELAWPGWIDYTRGAAFSYTPLIDVLKYYERGNSSGLRELFAGRIVLVGSVLPYLDRLQLPAALTAWELAGTPQPGVILTAQVLRNAAGSGLLRPAGLLLRLALLAAAAAIAFAPPGPMRWGALAASLACAFAAATALHALGWVLPPAQAMLAATSAAIARTALDLGSARRERERLRQALRGYLSPYLLQALLQGAVDTRGTRRAIALLFADLHGFTSWSETADAELVRDTLNGYYGAVTPVLHAHGGTIDNFRGDGIMVMFGALPAQAHACDSAFSAARQMFEAIARLNATELAARGVPPIEVSIGLAFGEVLIGDLGSPERKDYTALGDAVNVAARLQELAKTLGFAVVMTQAFAQQLRSAQTALQDLGTQPLKGHSPVAVWGWAARAHAAAKATC